MLLPPHDSALLAFLLRRGACCDYLWQELNNVIYIDSDTIWLEDPYVLWSRFWAMPPQACIGIAAENIDPGELRECAQSNESL